MNNRTSMHTEWELPQNTCGLKIFVVEAWEDGKKQQVIRNPLIIDIIEWDTTTTSSFATTLRNNMIMFAETFAKGDHHICADADLPELKPAMIVDMIKCSWSNISLKDDTPRLKRVLTVLNFYGPLQTS